MENRKNLSKLLLWVLRKTVDVPKDYNIEYQPKTETGKKIAGIIKGFNDRGDLLDFIPIICTLVDGNEEKAKQLIERLKHEL